MSKYSINESTVKGIADAVRNMRHEKQLMTPAMIEAKIRASLLGIPIWVSTHINPETGKWERPEEYPDLDGIVYSDEYDTVYMTYDLRKTPDYGWIGVSVVLEDTSASASVERGHLVDGAFVADASYTMAHDDPFRMDLDDTDGDVQLWRVRSESGIKRFYFRTNTATTADNFPQKLQPCVEITGQLNHLTGAVSDSLDARPNCVSFGTVWLERDSRRLGGDKLTTLSSCWNQCYSLQSLDLSGWDTTNWAVTTLSSCWSGCYSLQSLDLSGWDTTNWAVTSLSSCWNQCYSLQSLDLSGWDTTNWAVTDTRNLWSTQRITKSIKTPVSIGIVPTATSNVNTVPNQINIEEFTGYAVYINHTYADASCLTPASLVSILDRLPTVTAARTITLGQTNILKLTQEQIAVATQKGWTVA